MKYFHRATVPSEAVLAAAHEFFGGRLTPVEEAPRRRAYSGAIGKVTISARAEGGHYTMVDVQTDQVGESELDRLAKRFLAELHRSADPQHQVRGAY